MSLSHLYLPFLKIQPRFDSGRLEIVYRLGLDRISLNDRQEHNRRNEKRQFDIMERIKQQNKSFIQPNKIIYKHNKFLITIILQQQSLKIFSIRQLIFNR